MVSAGSEGGAVGIDAGVDEAGSGALLAPPLEVIADGYIWHTHIQARVLLVGVPSAQGFRSMVIVAEGHYDAGAELPFAIIV